MLKPFSYYFHPAEFQAGWCRMHDWRISLFELIILAVTIYWLLSFFGKSVVSGIQHTEGFIDVLSVLIVVLIIIRFLA